MTVYIDTESRIIHAPDGLHSSWGPSSAKKWINCSGSINAAKGRKKKSSSYANEGTAAHAVSEICRHRNVKAEEFKGYIVRVSRGNPGEEDFETSDHVCDQEMVDSVQEFIDYCNDVPAEQVLIEQLLPYAEYVPPGFGTLDDARLNDDLCVITDFKHGKGVQVWAKDCEQLMLQALGVYLRYKGIFSFKKFILRIAQPRIGHFDEWETTLEHILKWANEVAARAYIRTLEPNAPRTAGDWCMFCPAKYDCDARAKTMLGHMVGEFADLTEATALVKEADVDTGRMTPEDVARCLGVFDQIKGWIKDVEAHGRLEALAGRPPQIPGEEPWKFVEGRSKRVYSVDEEELLEAAEDAGVPSNVMYTKKLITPAKLEKIIGKKHEIMIECVRKPPGRPKLVPPTDKRKTMAQAMVEQFADLDEEKEDDDD
jgi:hypothetical protein